MDQAQIRQMSFQWCPNVQSWAPCSSLLSSVICRSHSGHQTDDSLLYCAVNKASDCQLLQQDLIVLEQWEADWQISFNPSKCTVIRVHTGRKVKFQSSYRLHGQTIEVVGGSKYLGVTVTYNLTWSKHVSAIAGKARRSLGFLWRNFKHCFRQVKAATYTTVVRPVMGYAATV